MSRSDPVVMSIDQMSPGSGSRRPKTCILCTFELLQGFNSQEVTVTSQDRMSRDPT